MRRSRSRKRSPRFRTRRSPRSWSRPRARQGPGDELPYVVAHREGLIGASAATSTRAASTRGGYRVQRRPPRRRARGSGRHATCSATKASTSARSGSIAPAIPASSLLTTRRAKRSRRLLIAEEDVDVNVNFLPHPPAADVEGRIISVLAGVR